MRLDNPMMWLRAASQNKAQTVMFQGTSTLGSSGTGTAYATIPFDPSSAGYSFAEWGDITALWNEVKFIASEIQVTPFNVTALTSGTPLFIGYRFDTNAAPTSLANVTQLPSTKTYSIERDTSRSGVTYRCRARGPLNWSTTASVTTAPYAGCPGSWQFAGTSYPTSIALVSVRVKSIYLVRGRM